LTGNRFNKQVANLQDSFKFAEFARNEQEYGKIKMKDQKPGAPVLLKYQSLSNYQIFKSSN